jgi:hypothetical protein
MGRKLLFLLGIVLAHGALAAAWVKNEEPQPRQTVASCVNTPVPMPWFQPQHELLAQVVLHEEPAQP